MKPHKIHSARFSANQQKVTVYTSCGRVQVTIDKDITLGIKVHIRPHKTKTISYGIGRFCSVSQILSWTLNLKPKPRYKQVRTTRRLGTK